jgi:hypothetical protein
MINDFMKNQTVTTDASPVMAREVCDLQNNVEYQYWISKGCNFTGSFYRRNNISNNQITNTLFQTAL